MLYLNFMLPVPPAVENAAHFHYILNDNIENGKITHLNPVIRIPALFYRMKESGQFSRS